MFIFKLRHRLKSYLMPRKPKFKSDKDEMAWLIQQGRNETGCQLSNLTPEQRARWTELTDRPFPDYGIVIR